MRWALLLVVAIATRATADTPQIAQDDTRDRDTRICVLPYGEPDGTITRFGKLFAHVRSIKTVTELEGCHVVVMPSDWIRDRETFHDQLRRGVEAWVKAGGALLVFQPNPTEGDATVELCNTWFRVHNWYDAKDGAVKVIDHPIVANVATTDLSFPADQITSFDTKRWTAVVRGSVTQSASLIVTTFGKGRVAVDTDNPIRDWSVGPAAKHGDPFVRALVAWLVDRSPARAARAY